MGKMRKLLLVIIGLVANLVFINQCYADESASAPQSAVFYFNNESQFVEAESQLPRNTFYTFNAPPGRMIPFEYEDASGRMVRALIPEQGMNFRVGRAGSTDAFNFRISPEQSESNETLLEYSPSGMREQVHGSRSQDRRNILERTFSPGGAGHFAAIALPTETAAFYMAVGLQTWGKVLMDAAANPSAMEQLLLSLEEPATYMSFASFVIAARVSGHMIGQIFNAMNTLKYGSAEARAMSTGQPGARPMRLHRLLQATVPMAVGMAASHLVEGYLHDPDIEFCAEAQREHITGTSTDLYAYLGACDRAYRNWVLGRKIFSTEFGIQVAGLLAASAANQASWNAIRSAVSVIGGRAATARVSAFSLSRVLITFGGRLNAIPGFQLVGTVANLLTFLVISDALNTVLINPFEKGLFGFGGRPQGIQTKEQEIRQHLQNSIKVGGNWDGRLENQRDWEERENDPDCFLARRQANPDDPVPPCIEDGRTLSSNLRSYFEKVNSYRGLLMMNAQNAHQGWLKFTRRFVQTFNNSTKMYKEVTRLLARDNAELRSEYDQNFENILERLGEHPEDQPPLNVLGGSHTAADVTTLRRQHDREQELIELYGGPLRNPYNLYKVSYDQAEFRQIGQTIYRANNNSITMHDVNVATVLAQFQVLHAAALSLNSYIASHPCARGANVGWTRVRQLLLNDDYTTELTAANQTAIAAFNNRSERFKYSTAVAADRPNLRTQEFVDAFTQENKEWEQQFCSQQLLQPINAQHTDFIAYWNIRHVDQMAKPNAFESIMQIAEYFLAADETIPLSQIFEIQENDNRELIPRPVTELEAVRTATDERLARLHLVKLGIKKLNQVLFDPRHDSMYLVRIHNIAGIGVVGSYGQENVIGSISPSDIENILTNDNCLYEDDCRDKMAHFGTLLKQNFFYKLFRFIGEPPDWTDEYRNLRAHIDNYQIIQDFDEEERRHAARYLYDAHTPEFPDYLLMSMLCGPTPESESDNLVDEEVTSVESLTDLGSFNWGHHAEFHPPRVIREVFLRGAERLTVGDANHNPCRMTSLSNRSEAQVYSFLQPLFRDKNWAPSATIEDSDENPEAVGIDLIYNFPMLWAQWIVIDNPNQNEFVRGMRHLGGSVARGLGGLWRSTGDVLQDVGYQARNLWTNLRNFFRGSNLEHQRAPRHERPSAESTLRQGQTLVSSPLDFLRRYYRDDLLQYEDENLNLRLHSWWNEQIGTEFDTALTSFEDMYQEKMDRYYGQTLIRDFDRYYGDVPTARSYLAESRRMNSGVKASMAQETDFYFSILWQLYQFRYLKGLGPGANLESNWSNLQSQYENAQDGTLITFAADNHWNISTESPREGAFAGFSPMDFSDEGTVVTRGCQERNASATCRENNHRQLSDSLTNLKDHFFHRAEIIKSTMLLLVDFVGDNVSAYRPNDNHRRGEPLGSYRQMARTQLAEQVFTEVYHADDPYWEGVDIEAEGRFSNSSFVNKILRRKLQIEFRAMVQSLKLGADSAAWNQFLEQSPAPTTRVDGEPETATQEIYRLAQELYTERTYNGEILWLLSFRFLEMFNEAQDYYNMNTLFDTFAEED